MCTVDRQTRTGDILNSMMQCSHPRLPGLQPPLWFYVVIVMDKKLKEYLFVSYSVKYTATSKHQWINASNILTCVVKSLRTLRVNTSLSISISESSAGSLFQLLKVHFILPVHCTLAFWNHLILQQLAPNTVWPLCCSHRGKAEKQNWDDLHLKKPRLWKLRPSYHFTGTAKAFCAYFVNWI